jgi:anti-sigma factor RsiW
MGTSASILPWDPQGLVAAEAAQKAEGERICQARLDRERYMRETTEREEAARHASLYRARQEELNKKLRELEAEEATAAGAYSRQMEAATTHRLTVNRQIELLHQAASARVPPLGHTPASTARSLLPTHLQGLAPSSSLGALFPTSCFIDGIAAIGFATPKNDAPQVEMPRPEEANQE